jgi:hypothetical protein
MTMVMTMMTSMIMMMISSSAGTTTATLETPSPPFAGTAPSDRARGW